MPVTGKTRVDRSLPSYAGPPLTSLNFLNIRAPATTHPSTAGHAYPPQPSTSSTFAGPIRS